MSGSALPRPTPYLRSVQEGLFHCSRDTCTHASAVCFAEFILSAAEGLSMTCQELSSFLEKALII